jgi:hypothetical protein
MFDTINHMLFNKKGEMTNELLEDFSPYMVTRYLSFYDDDLLNYANETVNKYSQIFETDEERFRFFENVIPKLKRKRINYISKKKNKDNHLV